MFSFLSYTNPLRDPVRDDSVLSRFDGSGLQGHQQADRQGGPIRRHRSDSVVVAFDVIRRRFVRVGKKSPLLHFTGFFLSASRTIGAVFLVDVQAVAIVTDWLEGINT